MNWERKSRTVFRVRNGEMGMKRLLGIWAVVSALMMGSATVVLADYEAGLKAYDAGDHATALREWRPLAGSGDADAQYNLGQMYRNGQGVAQDYKEAVKWYRKAAEQGILKAQVRLGSMSEFGQGTVKDYKKAVEWYRKAATKGDSGGQFSLGLMFYSGRGVLRDLVKAYMWFDIAGIKDIAKVEGIGSGSELIAEIEAEMTSAQVTEAQKLARECMKKNHRGCGR
jgi:uncharacterized protein